MGHAHTFVDLLAMPSLVFGAETDDLVGTWKLVSWQVIRENGSQQDVFGAHPKGFLILTREGRAEFFSEEYYPGKIEKA